LFWIKDHQQTQDFAEDSLVRKTHPSWYHMKDFEPKNIGWVRNQ